MENSAEKLEEIENVPSVKPRESGSEWVSIQTLTNPHEHINEMIVCSDELRKVIKTITRLSPYRQTVLIEGESGTGKELIARALHSLGTPPIGPFVTFNCSNLVASLAESQLFGHVKGAFTDAREDALGYFRSANGGTLFLDEIGELPLALQPKLLRAVENHEVQPVGSTQTYKVDIRLVGATNRDLQAMMRAGTFREDLFYRLNSSTIVLPPLRDRKDAIPCFVAHFIEHYNKLFGKRVQYVSPQVVEAFRAYGWPGNIRELAHAVETLVLMCDGSRIALQDLPAFLSHPAPAQALDDPAPVASIKPIATEPNEPDQVAPASLPGMDWELPDGSPLLLDNMIRKTLVRSLHETEGNRRRAANLLGVSRSTLYRMLSRYGLGENLKHRAPEVRTTS